MQRSLPRRNHGLPHALFALRDETNIMRKAPRSISRARLSAPGNDVVEETLHFPALSSLRANESREQSATARTAKGKCARDDGLSEAIQKPRRQKNRIASSHWLLAKVEASLARMSEPISASRL